MPIKRKVEKFFEGKMGSSKFTRDAVMNAVTIFVIEQARKESKSSSGAVKGE